MGLKFKSRKELFESAKNTVNKISDYKAKHRSDNYTGTPMRENVSFGNVGLNRHHVVANQVVRKHINVIEEEKK